MKKYELTDETKIVNGHTLYRIKALRSFSDVKEGEFGGWVESEKNLSHDGNCWVRGDACVYGNAGAYGDARVYGNAGAYGDARVSERSHVFNNARVFGGSRIYGNAMVCGNAMVYGNAKVRGRTRVSGNAWVCENAHIYGNTQVSEHVWLAGKSRVYGDAILRLPSNPLLLININLEHGTWEGAIIIKNKRYLVSNLLDLYEVPQ